MIHHFYEQSPILLTVPVDVYNYKLFYTKLFGGAVMFLREHFEKIKGFSNWFWLWGHEEDNLYGLVVRNRLKVNRQPPNLAHYKATPHEKRLDKDTRET